MARKKNPHTLPLFTEVSDATNATHETAQLLEVLRRVGRTHQRDEAQPFYPVREIAQRFRVPLSTVARVYAQLEKECLLSRIRGSKTMLQGRLGAPKIAVRGFIALPVRLSFLTALQDYRMFFVHAQRVLRKHGFAPTNVFFETHDRGPDLLLDSIRQNDFDTVLWLLPSVHAKETVLRLGDKGVHVVGVCDRGWSPVPCQYQVFKETAIRTILREWRCQNITAVKVLRAGEECVLSEAKLSLLLQESGIPYKTIRSGSDSVKPFLHLKCLDPATAVILPAAAASLLSFHAADLLAHLMQRCRVALIDGLVNVHLAKAPQAKVDLVMVDWAEITEQIARNLAARNLHLSAPATFEARAYMRVPLSEYAQSI